MKYDSLTHDCYDLYTIKTNKFNLCHLEIIFENEITKEIIPILSLLFDVLLTSSKLYKDERLLKIKLEELYNTNIYYTNTRIGKTVLTNVCVDFLNSKNINEDITEEVFKLVLDLIFNPYVVDKKFDEDTFLKTQVSSLENILKIRDDKKQNSIMNAISILEENPEINYNVLSGLECIKDINAKKLYQFYKRFLNDSKVSIYYIGPQNKEIINSYIKKYAIFKSINTKKYLYYLDDFEYNKVIKKHNKQKLNQTNIVLVYKLMGLTKFERDYVMPIYNILWGSGSLESKLYREMRLINSYCYNVSTYYQKYDKLLIAHTAVDKNNYRNALKIFKSTMKKMRVGDITCEELKSAKNMVIDIIKTINDSETKLIDNYVFTNIIGLESIDSRIDNFNKISIEDVIKLSKKIKLLVVYREGI